MFNKIISSIRNFFKKINSFLPKNKFIKALIYLFTFIILFFAAVDLNFLWLFGYSPGFSDLKNPPLATASELYTADSVLIGRYYTENRTPVEFKDLPPNLKNALIDTEDARFYQHSGIDIRSLFSSIFSTLSGDKRGASTITQQLSKNLYQTRRERSFGLLTHIPFIKTVIYKTKEWLTAVKLEMVYSKDEILTLYLNTVPFGNNSFGIKVAANKYFNKQVNELTTEESAVLVGMLKATSTYNPITNAEKSKERRNVVLSQMNKYNHLPKDEYLRLSTQPIFLDLSYKEDNKQEKDSYIRNAVANWIKDWAKENDYDIYADGLKIYTTIDSRMQKYAEEAVSDRMAYLQRRFYGYWQSQNPWTDEEGNEIPNYLETMVERLPVYKALTKKYKGNIDSINEAINQKKRMTVFTWKGDRDTTFSTVDSMRYYSQILQTGLMTFEPSTSHIRAWVGGIDFDHFKFDHVIQAKRQAGSTFKPFVYLTALDNGWSPCDKIKDQSVTINYVENGEKKSWSPKNADWHFTGYDMTLRWAMGRSCNSVTAQLTEKVGWDNVVKYAHKCGIESPLKSVPSVGLGSNDVSLFEMITAYGVFLNKGMYAKPLLVTKIYNKEGKLIKEFKPELKRVLSEETAWLMIYMLQGGIQEPGGTSQALWEYDLFKKGNEIGGKTGTTSNYSDGWYMGVTKDLITGTWVGCEDRNIHFMSSAYGEGSKTALPIFGKYMEKIYGDPSLGITMGKFPKPTVKIATKYYCPTSVPRRDTTSGTDSVDTDYETLPDSIITGF
ncbi:penicillin-binding protein 1A [Solitalea canadensis]|uniref:Membrane carboxypeptidase/penicillin-binding protein n=1 Tax=Solitalea canadensis (strain ATCC 29591 / DSM 3403 / JCM 21819 / LMG 8368 / NBRC 15130 / NCIMB 12057 / USAM 9D) TaxID=929556 RepID=H8KVI3_SOLCM|nr:transglycosylase domain-containing protein [Solitalea canadensis]AFD06486.1 membrane carboxypeptidase/penicillin-binding protein [Solitalea canadensis DSM 3403]